MNFQQLLAQLQGMGLGNNFMSRTRTPYQVDYKAPGYNPGMDSFPVAPNATGWNSGGMAQVGQRQNSPYGSQMMNRGLLYNPLMRSRWGRR